MLTMEYIKENEKTYQVQIEELTNRVEYEQRRNQRKDKEIKRLNKCIKDDKENANEIMAEQQREIERLNNIINELERYIIDFKEDYEKNEFQPNAKVYIYWKDLIDKIQELKGSDKE